MPIRLVGKHCESGDLLVREGKVPADLAVGDIVATPVTGAEKDRLYRRFVELAGAYAVYRGRTDRDLRMFVLTRR